MTPKQELDILRKEKRLADLEAKAIGGFGIAPQQVTQAQEPAVPETWGDVGTQAFSNLGPSAMQFGKDTYEALRHPIDSASNVWDIGKGVLQLLKPGEQADEAKAKAVGQFFVDRYGVFDEFGNLSADNIKKTIANDPVGALGDISMLLTGGGSALARTPGVVGKFGQATAKVGNIIDPATLAVKGVGKAGHYGGRLASNVLGGIGTGAGKASIDAAYDAGKIGGAEQQAFRKAIKKKDSLDEMTESAKGAVKQMAKEREIAYDASKPQWLNDSTPIDFEPINAKWRSLKPSMTEYKGLPTIGKEGKIFEEIDKALSIYRARPDVHTAGGLDALKHLLDSIYPSPEMKKAQKAVTTMRNTVEDLIIDQVPAYAEAMKKFEDSIKRQKQIEKTFSLGRDAMEETSGKKLLSSMRDGVETNYGKRLEYAKELEGYGAENLRSRLAGETLSSVVPRGLVGKLVGSGLGSAGFGNPWFVPLALSTSPRLTGNMANIVGKGARYGNLTKQLLEGVGLTPSRARNVVRGAVQEGRIDESVEKQLSRLLGDK